MNATTKISLAMSALVLGVFVFAASAPGSVPPPAPPQAAAAPAHGAYTRIAFDQDKCIESCDMQYSTCENNGNESGYCSQQHDRCVNGCLSHQ